MYDDNINASSENKEDDFITTFMIGMGINHESRTQSLQFLGHINQQIYFKHFDLSNNSQDLSVNYSNEITAYDSLHIGNIFNHHPETQTFEDSLGRTPGRHGYYSNTSNIRYTKLVIRQLSFDTHYSYSFTKHSSEEEMDSYSHSTGITTGYLWNATNSSFLSYNYIYTEYETEESNSEHTANIGHNYMFSRRLSTSCHAGIVYIKTSDDNSYSPSVSVSIRDEIDENNIIVASILKQRNTSAHTDEVSDDWRISGNFTREISRDISYSFAIFYGQSETSPSNTTNKLFGAITSFTYIITENVNSAISYTLTRSITEEEGASDSRYFRNQVQLSLSGEF
ncbi:MAG: hypothetical protein SVR08_18565 [Spirochaetota bacterium]|nr:hypothetical protein [Spirochaetota bacterium]